MAPHSPLTSGRIARFWAPLAATWLMMAAEGPFVAALIARLPEPKLNLAAWGVAIAFAMLIEAPVIMMMSAATALVRDRQSLAALRRFAYALNGTVTAVMLVLLVPSVFSFVAGRLVGLPEDVTRLAHRATALLLPWPAAIGYRRFYQGVLIRRGQTRRVAFGTVTRLVGMSATGLAAYAVNTWPGVAVGALALSAGVVLEAAATRLWAARAVREVAASEAAAGSQELSSATIARFDPRRRATCAAQVLSHVARPRCIMTVAASGSRVDTSSWQDRLYRPVAPDRRAARASARLTAIPYYAWAHRGKGEMAVWLPRDTKSLYTQPAN